MRDAGTVTVAAGEHAEEGAARLGETEDHLHRRGRLDRDDLDLPGAVEIGATRPAGFRIEKTRPGPGDFARRQRRTIVEGHAVAQGEGVASPILGDCDVLCQHRRHRAVGAPGDQAFVDILQHRSGVVVGADARHQAADIGRDHGAEQALGPDRCRGRQHRKTKNGKAPHYTLSNATRARAPLRAWQNPPSALPRAALWCSRAAVNRRCRRAILVRRYGRPASPRRDRRPARRRRDRG